MLVAEEDGVAVVDASAIPMRQNVRGCVYPMAGIARVATLPLARRRGPAGTTAESGAALTAADVAVHEEAIVDRLLADLRLSGKPQVPSGNPRLEHY